MPITHQTIPVPPDQVGQTEWAEEHTLPTAAEVGAMTTASVSQDISAALTPYLTSDSASTQYARQASAVTTAQLSIYLTSGSAASIYLTQSSANSQFLSQSSAEAIYAHLTSAVTTAQLSIYLTSASAAGIYLTQSSANAQFAAITSALTTAQGDARYASVGATGFTEASADARYGVLKVVAADVSSATTGALVTVPDLIFSVSASVAYRLEYQLVYRSSATTTNIGVGVSCTPTPGVFMCAVDIYAQATDGTGTIFSGYASANGDIVVGTTTNMAAADLPLIMQATIVTGAAGQVQCIFRSEVSNSNVVIRRGSSARMNRLGAV